MISNNIETSLVLFPNENRPSLKINKKHPSVPRKFMPTPSSIKDLIPEHIPQYQNVEWDNYCRFSILAARPINVSSLSGSTNPAYAIPGVYFCFQVPRNEIESFYQMFDSGKVKEVFEKYACYVGESQATKPSDRMGGRVNSFKNSLVKQLSGTCAPSRDKGLEASAFKVAKNMIKSYDQYVDETGAYTSMADCLFFSYVDYRHIKGVNGVNPPIFWVERSLISLYENNGKLVNSN